jgi:dihydrofolate reductase
MDIFKSYTTGGTVIMGRKTFESLPNRKPLANRTNIVLTRDMNYHPEGVLVAHNPHEAISLRENEQDQTWVIGGEQIYRTMFPYCDKVYIGMVQDNFYEADAVFDFPEINDPEKWRPVEVSIPKVVKDTIRNEHVIYRFTIYEHIYRNSFYKSDTTDK